MSEQQRSLNDFLATQQENTEISYFSAAKDKSHQEYRSAICRQLAGHVVGSFIRPLNQLLSEPGHGLNPEQGLYLVCITQAEQLDQSFLQELWDWVMNSQQGEKKPHLNVILFGETKWANDAQEWLPMQNSNKPVLLSSEEVDPTGFDVNALEALMADKSSWLSASNQPIVTNKWFIGSVLSVFFVIFVGLMTWQYPQQLLSLFSDEDIAQSNAYASAETDAELLSKLKQINTSMESTEPSEVVLAAKVEAYQTSAPSQTTPDPKSVTQQLLVSNWQDEETENPNTQQISIPANTQELSDENIDSVLRQASSQVQPSKEVSSSSERIVNDASQQASSSSEDIDFQVPDIISIEQLDAQFDQNLQDTDQNEQSAEITINTSNNTLELASPNNTPASPNSNTLISEQSASSIDYKFDETTLLSLPTDAIVLQLSGIQNPVVLENYLNNYDLKTSTWVYETKRYGGPWYVVLYNQSFDSIDAALSQLSRLPDDVKEAQPFAKSINQIQQEISRR